MAGAGAEFVEGWLVAQVLGEGAYGEVRLLVHARSGARVALKAVGAGGAREAALHRALRHPHVLRCLGERAHRDTHYLFLEYAAGGELFERIEPDRGMAPGAARRYWRQLGAGLRYLHARGVAHRDIKPENLLLDHRDNIKISDFGMATLFRHGSRERLVSRVCGTVPYAAPEVLSAPQRAYRAPPADLWAAAVVLVAMLAGELPWERAHESDPRYAAWARWVTSPDPGPGEGGAPAGVWRRVAGAGAAALGWLRRALHPAPARRAPLAALLLDRWMSDYKQQAGGSRGCLSQPAGGGGAGAGAGADEADCGGWGEGEGALQGADMDAMLSCSQPASADDLLLSSQLSPLTQQALREPHVRAAGEVSGGVSRRLARVWLAGGEAAAARAVGGAAARAGCGWRRLDARTLALQAGADVRMRAWLLPARGGAATLVQFRRWRGCGLAFQRRFLEIRAALAEHAAPAPDDAATAEPMDEDHV